MMENMKILIVDDEINIINALKRVLNRYSYQIISTTKPEHGIEIIDSTDLDMVICDFNMPNINGIELLKHSKEVRPGAIRILITGYYDVDIAVSAINEGNVYHYITKPWKNEEVVTIIQKGLMKRQEELKQNNIYKFVNESQSRILEMEEKLEQSNKANRASNKRFPVFEDETIVLINSKDILYLTSQEGNVHIYTEKNKYLSNESLSTWEAKLEDEDFFRSHRSYIVNIEKIEKISPWFNGSYNLKLINCDDNIPVSRANAKVLKDIFGI